MKRGFRMLSAKRPLAVTVVLLGVTLAGCGSAGTPSSIPASGRLVGASATSPGRVVLSALGAQRIGIRAVAARAVPTPPTTVKSNVAAGLKHTIKIPGAKPSAAVTIPYSAVIYDSSGATYAFTNTAPLTYVEVPITVQQVSGNLAYLSAGPKPGAHVVSVGAEELYGVQTGVLAQT
jgi:hypothetical protein